MTVEALPVGNLLRTWRQRRRLSQLALACDAEISQRHLSFLESGRAAPSRDMILHLAEQLDIPLRDRNLLLVAAGLRPSYPGRPRPRPALDGALQPTRIGLTSEAPDPQPAVDLARWLLAAPRVGSL